jgi:TonB family protein
MRRILLSTLFLSAALVHAQTAAKGQSASLESRNESAIAIPSTQPTADGGSIPSARRVSTGVVWPKLISEPTVRVAATDFPTSDLAAQHMVVSFRVDEKGLPQNVHLLKSVNQAIDERVLDAVRQYRFVPGTLDDQNVAVDVNLVVNFEKK